VSVESLAQTLLSRGSVRADLHALANRAVANELGKRFEAADDLTLNAPLDWGALLLTASALSLSESGDAQLAALRIAQGCLMENPSDGTYADGAGLVLDALANHQALDLAVRRQLVAPNLADRLPLPARLDWSRRTFENQVDLVGGDSLAVNRFQRALWDELQIHDRVSVSAPTSAGKSFILGRWVFDLVSSGSTLNVVYLVPTRALVSQVEHDLRRLVSKGAQAVNVTSMPLPGAMSADEPNILVFTQERLHLLLTTLPSLAVGALIVDEAHKFGDSERGVLLQDVVERVIALNPQAKILYASPLTSNPELLVEDEVDASRVGVVNVEVPTVVQNVLWLTQVNRKPKEWNVELLSDGEPGHLGLIRLPDSPTNQTKRQTFLATAIGGSDSGNIVYVNGPSRAEAAAVLIRDQLGPAATTDDAEIADLIELSRTSVHPEFLLNVVLERGIAFHYGNMPQMLRLEIERLFTEGKIKYLVCTSTLIEGVNLACRNVFLKAPQKGMGSHITAEDFWNLAGRAGRWGTEFQGNVFCIDANKETEWAGASPPRRRSQSVIRRSADQAFLQPDRFIEYITSEEAKDPKQRNSGFDSIFSYLTASYLRRGDLETPSLIDRFGADTVARLESSVEEVFHGLGVPERLIERHPGVSPYGLAALISELRATRVVEALIPPDPASDDAVDAFASIFLLLGRTTSPAFGQNERYATRVALVVTWWMRGAPLPLLISQRIRYEREHQGAAWSTSKQNTVIRTVLEDVEKMARFQAPRGLACYRDALELVLGEVDRSELLQSVPDFSLLLEFGLAQETQISLVTVGLSRATAIAVSEIIASDSLSVDQAIEWLIANRNVWSVASLPRLVVREIDAVLAGRADG